MDCKWNNYHTTDRMGFKTWRTVLLLVAITSVLCVGQDLNERFISSNGRVEVLGPTVPDKSTTLETSSRRFRVSKVVQPNHQQYDDVVLAAYKETEIQDSQLIQRYKLGVDKKSPEFPGLVPIMLNAGNHKLADETNHISKSSRLINWIASIARNRNLNTPIAQLLNSRVAQQTNITCPFKSIPCPTLVYRRVDGKCNNIGYPLRGASYTPLGREVQSSYDTGRVNNMLRYDLPRQTARDGSPLPSARLVSNIVHSESTYPLETQVTMLYTNYGQALAHDLTDTPVENGYEGSKLICCNQTVPTDRCAPITIPSNDFFSQFNRNCMNFFRSAEVTDVNCQSGERQQLNIATSYVDGTQVYGHSVHDAVSLQEDHDGLLKISIPNHLPFQQHPHFGAFQSGINFLKAGDEKVSESLGLIGVVTLWHREHNRIATILAEIPRFAQLNDQLRNTVIYEETRKIVIAEMQHVTYKEYLQVTLGPSLMQSYQLTPQTNGYFYGYDPLIDPSVSNGFSAAHFRFGHSMIRNQFSVLDSNYQPTRNTMQLKKIFWRPNFYLLFENGFQRGVLTDASEVCDRHLSSDLRNHMFETKPGNGVDLAALNIQRGRDHGLPSYSEFRKAVFLSYPTEWSTNSSRGLSDMDQDTINKFRSIYRDPRDIDVWSGGVSEIRIVGAQVGPLFGEYLGRQFNRLKFGDRFWYESSTTGFTLERLNEVRKTSMAKIMCNNLSELDIIQKNAFLAATSGGINDRVACSSLPDIDFRRWF